MRVCSQPSVRVTPPHALSATVTYAGRPAVIASRCWVGGEWLYGLRLPSGEVVNYVPERMVTC